MIWYIYIWMQILYTYNIIYGYNHDRISYTYWSSYSVVHVRSVSYISIQIHSYSYLSYVDTYAPMYVRTYVRMYACMHACMNVCMYVCTGYRPSYMGFRKTVELLPFPLAIRHRTVLPFSFSACAKSVFGPFNWDQADLGARVCGVCGVIFG
jgi:hypothetical protein